MEEIGVVIYSAVLDEHGLGDAVAVHRKLKGLDRLKPVVAGVAMGVDYQHLVASLGLYFLKQTTP